MRRILHGEDTTPGATHFFVYNSTMSEVLDPVYAPIEYSIDIEARRGRLAVPGVVDAVGSPIIDPSSGGEFRARIDLPGGFEYTVAEMGTGTASVTGAISFALDGTYGQFNELHVTQDGVVR